MMKAVDVLIFGVLFAASIAMLTDPLNALAVSLIVFGVLYIVVGLIID